MTAVEVLFTIFVTGSTSVFAGLVAVEKMTLRRAIASGHTGSPESNYSDDDLRDFDRRLWGPIDDICYDCAFKMSPRLAQVRRELWVEAWVEAQARGCGPLGMTGRMNCAACGGWRKF